MNAAAMLKAEKEASQKEAAIEARVMHLARINWTRLCKLDPAEMLLAAIEIGLRNQDGETQLTR